MFVLEYLTNTCGRHWNGSRYRYTIERRIPNNKSNLIVFGRINSRNWLQWHRRWWGIMIWGSLFNFQSRSFAEIPFDVNKRTAHLVNCFRFIFASIETHNCIYIIWRSNGAHDIEFHMFQNRKQTKLCLSYIQYYHHYCYHILEWFRHFWILISNFSHFWYRQLSFHVLVVAANSLISNSFFVKFIYLIACSMDRGRQNVNSEFKLSSLKWWTCQLIIYRLENWTI